MDGTDLETGRGGRSVSMHVAGDDAAELELAALDEARRFFGADVRLTVSQNYVAALIASSHVDRAIRESGKLYHASMLVRAADES